MSGATVLYSAAFFIYGLMEVLGLMPQEISSAGITLPGLFAKYFGDPVSLSLSHMHLYGTGSVCCGFYIQHYKLLLA